MMRGTRRGDPTRAEEFGKFNRFATAQEPPGQSAERQRRDSVWMEPDRYLDPFFRTAACTVNFIRLLAGRHFEATKFVIELKGLLAARLADRPPRA